MKQTLEEEIKKVIEDILDSISWKALAVGGERWTGVEDECSEEVKDLITLIANRESQIRKEERRKAVEEVLRFGRTKLNPVGGLSNMEYISVPQIERLLAQTEEDLVKKEDE